MALFFSVCLPFRKAGGLHILCCQGIAVADYSVTLDALALKPSSFCNVGDKSTDHEHSRYPPVSFVPAVRFILAASAATKGLALIPWKTILRIMVQTTVIEMVPPPGRCSFNTITAKTILAKPRGPNQPINSFYLNTLIHQLHC